MTGNLFFKKRLYIQFQGCPEERVQFLMHMKAIHANEHFSQELFVLFLFKHPFVMKPKCWIFLYYHTLNKQFLFSRLLKTSRFV